MKKFDKSKFLNKETLKEFLKSVIAGLLPVALDLVLSSVIIYFMSLKNLGVSFKDVLFDVSSDVNPSTASTVVGTAVGYIAGFIAVYFVSVLFVYKYNKKAKTVKGILILVLVEVFAFGFNLLLGWLTETLIGLPHLISYIIRIGVSYVVIFALRKILVFTAPDENKNITEETSENAEEANDNQQNILDQQNN